MPNDFVLSLKVVLDFAALVYLLDLTKIAHGVIGVAAEDFTIDQCVCLGSLSALRPKLCI